MLDENEDENKRSGSEDSIYTEKGYLGEVPKSSNFAWDYLAQSRER